MQSTISELLQRAQALFHSGEIQAGLNQLAAAGELGHLESALNYSYAICPEHPTQVKNYLSAIGLAANPVIQYHKALIDRFYNSCYFTEEIIQTIYELALTGHIESTLVLLSWCVEDEKVFLFFADILRRRSPQIARQILTPFANNKHITQYEKVELENVIETVKSREQSISGLSVELIE